MSTASATFVPRVVTPPGRFHVFADFVVADSGLPDAIVPDARQHDIAELPDDLLVYLLGSRYCDTDLMAEFCRRMNIPARYCTGCLGDIVVPPVDDPMDFSAWFEAHLGGQWHTFDARYNIPRIGRVLVARGRDATARSRPPSRRANW
jgi:hypothetical protein